MRRNLLALSIRIAFGPRPAAAPRVLTDAQVAELHRETWLERFDAVAWQHLVGIESKPVRVRFRGAATADDVYDIGFFLDLAAQAPPPSIHRRQPGPRLVIPGEHP